MESYFLKNLVNTGIFSLYRGNGNSETITQWIHFYTYKHTLAIRLLVIVDADYKLLYVNGGCQGRIGDTGMYQNSSLCEALESSSLNIPTAEPLPNQTIPRPFVLVADEAFH